MDIDDSLEHVVANPEAFPLVSREVRRKPLRRFPYSLFYVIEPGRIRVVAAAHFKRRPNYWHSRLPG